MDQIFYTIFKTSIYSSIVGILILFIKGALKNKLTAKWTCLIWMVFIIKLIVPFGPESEFSIFNKIENINSKNYINNQVIKDEDNKDINELVNLAKESEDSSRISTTYNKTIGALWFIVAVTTLIFFILVHTIFNHNIKRKSIKVDKRTEGLLIRCKEKLNINKNIKIIVSDYVKYPAITGILKLKILIPLETLNLSEKELEYIFLHELSHYKRKDTIINYLLIVLQSIHWFNPLIWYLFIKIRDDIELATDEKVLRNLSHDEYKYYGHALLKIASQINNFKLYPKLISAVSNKKAIEKRLLNIKYIKSSTRSKFTITLIGSLVLVTIIPLFLTSAKADNLTEYSNKLVGTKEISKSENNKNLKLAYTGENGDMITADLLDGKWIDSLTNIGTDNDLVYKFP